MAKVIVLSGDLGGTNTRLRLTKIDPERPQLFSILFQKIYRAAEYKSLESAMSEFMKEAAIKPKEIHSFCYAVAGPVEDGEVRFTNLPWAVSEKLMANFFKVKRVKLINDFEAAGYGLETIKTEELEVLQNVVPDKTRPVGIIGAGTGLGVGCVVSMEGHTRSFPTEGGHIGFASRSEDEAMLLRYYQKFWHRVSVERFCSGPGIQLIYKFCVAHPLYYQKESPELQRILYTATSPSKEIVNFAINKKDPIAVRTLDLFLSIYGSAVGNVALTLYPKGGLYVVGNIAIQMADYIKDNYNWRFMRSFRDKGRVSGILSTIPLYIVMNKSLGIQGATLYAARMN